MKILAYGDVHLHEFSEFSKINKRGYSNRVDLALKSIDWVYQKAIHNNVDLIINLGDMYEYPKTTNNTLASLLAMTLENLSNKTKIPHEFIIGNHDMVDKNHRYTSIKPISKFFNDVIDKNNFKQIRKLNSKFGYICIPYMEDYTEAFEFLKSISVEDRKNIAIFGHFAVDDVRYTEDYAVKTVAKQSYFKDFKWSVFGHVHLRQLLDHNIIYPGSLLSHTFKDCVILDYDSNTFELLNNPWSPNFSTVEVSSENGVDELDNEEVNFYRLVVPPEKIESVLDKLEKIDSNYSIKPKSNIEKIDKVNYSAQDFESENSLLEKYVNSQDVLNKKSLVRYGKTLLGSINE
jgi:DNA repair exonuclease SbcCD nuclease subunit